MADADPSEGPGKLPSGRMRGLQTERIVLKIGNAEGAISEVPMRFNASHQHGYRCFIGNLANAPDEIGEDTPRSFEGRRLFDALARYREAIEPAGWRLLHAAARLDCWPKPDEFGPDVQILREGIERTEPVNGFERADFSEVGTLADQSASFEQWMKSLAPVFQPRVPPKAGHEHDPPTVEFGILARAAGEYLVDGKPNLDRLLGRATPNHPAGGRRDPPRKT